MSLQLRIVIYPTSKVKRDEIARSEDGTRTRCLPNAIFYNLNAKYDATDNKLLRNSINYI